MDLQQMVGVSPLEVGDEVVVRLGVMGVRAVVEDVLFVQSARRKDARFLYALSCVPEAVPIDCIFSRIVDGKEVPLGPERTEVREAGRW